ncbi:MAG: hypothetical protein KME26_08740 [Oscillatoria princeps RMCB-10]|nr:hypothetical protein [Oscillatoria princeps RMCB-10]
MEGGDRPTIAHTGSCIIAGTVLQFTAIFQIDSSPSPLQVPHRADSTTGSSGREAGFLREVPTRFNPLRTAIISTKAWQESQKDGAPHLQ